MTFAKAASWTAALALALTLAASTAARAQSCAEQIDHLQERLSNQIDRLADKSAFQTESTAAKMHRQPTAASVAAAASNGADPRPATSLLQSISLLERAREAAQQGNDRGCREYVSEVRSLIGG